MRRINCENICLVCGYAITDTKNDLILQRINEKDFTFHKKCVEKWHSWGLFKQSLRIRMHLIASKANESPSFYHGLNVAEDACNELITKAKKGFLLILKTQYETNFHDENERLKWFIRWFNPKELEIDEDGFVHVIV